MIFRLVSPERAKHTSLKAWYGDREPVAMTSRIKGPSDVDPASRVEAPEGPGEVAPTAPAQVDGAGAPTRAALDPIAQVAEALRAGDITVEQAVERLIDDAIHHQVGHATQDRPELERRLRELLRGLASTDPFLLSRIRRLTMGK
jgi:hypothetical protein